jgi:hemerythrin
VQIQWDEVAKIGEKTLDDQHKSWISFYNKLDEAMTDKSWGDVRQTKSEVLKEMIEYVDYHFNYEEEFMRSLGYAEAEKHWRIHRNFRDKIYRLYRDHLDGKPVLNREMMEVIKNWFLDHILKEDMKIAASLPVKNKKG